MLPRVALNIKNGLSQGETARFARPFFESWLCNALHGETRSAPASFTCIGIAKGEPAVIQSVLPVDFHTGQVNAVRFVHYTGNAFNRKMVVGRIGTIKTQHIAESRTTTSLHPYPQYLGIVEAGRRHQSLNFFDGAGR